MLTAHYAEITPLMYKYPLSSATHLHRHFFFILLLPPLCSSLPRQPETLDRSRLAAAAAAAGEEQEGGRGMVRVSNNLVGILNFVTFLLAIPILAGGIWLSNRASTDCERFLERPVIALGVFLMVVSLAGIVGACCRVSCLLWLYLLVMFILIVLVFCFTVFAFVVTNKGAGEVVSGRGYKEYRLGDYSNWLQKRVNSDKNWARIRSCLQDSNVCRSMQQGNETMDQFFRDNLSPIQVSL